MTRHGYRVPVTGVFDERTRQQVRRFQAAKGIRTTGNVGPLTWAALERTSRPPTVGRPTVTPVGGARSPPARLRQPGTGGTDRPGPALPASLTVPVTGIFGTITQRQVRRFQAARGLATTGRIGLGTWAALRLQPSASASSSGPGSRGAAVRILQRRLRVHGYTLPVTGFYGDGTTTAVTWASSSSTGSRRPDGSASGPGGLAPSADAVPAATKADAENDSAAYDDPGGHEDVPLSLTGRGGAARGR